MSAGHGYPARHIEGSTSRPQKHLERGVSIGDVGFINSRGGFSYYFNIFHAADDPIQGSQLPRKFTPIQPPLAEWKILTTEQYFPPGTVVVSEGVHANRISESPLYVLLFKGLIITNLLDRAVGRLAFLRQLGKEPLLYFPWERPAMTLSKPPNFMAT